MHNNRGLLGYDTLSDFTISMVGFKSTSMNFIFAIIAATTSFITSYVWDDAAAVYTLVFIILCDWITGVWKSISHSIQSNNPLLSADERAHHHGRRFHSYKAPRVLISMFVAFMILAVSWNASKHNLLFRFLPGMVYGGFTSTFLVSIYENLAELGYLPKNLITQITDKLKPKNPQQ